VRAAAIGWRLSLTLASCVFLAWSVQRSLHGCLAPRGSEQTWTVSAPANAARESERPGNDVWVLSVFADGRLLSREELERTGSWKEAGWGIGHLDAEPATMRFRGRRVTVSFLTSPSSGVVRVEGADGRGEEFDLFHQERDETTFLLVDLADGAPTTHGRSHEQDHARTAWMLIPALLLALLARPWRSSRALGAWVVAHVGVLHLLAWLTQGVGYNNDAPGYLEGFQLFAAGRNSYYPPGYPLFLAPWQALLPGSLGLAVTAVQHLLMLLTLCGLERTARRFLPEDLSVAALLLAGSVGPTVFLPQYLYSETAALFGMVGALWLASRPARVRSAAFDLVGGCFAAFASLARIVVLPTLALPVLLLHLSEHGLCPRAFVRTLRLLAVPVVVVLLAAAWIWGHAGDFSISAYPGLHLYDRVVMEQELLDRDGAATRRFLSLVGERPLRGAGHWDVTPILLESGLSRDDAVRVLSDVAREGIRGHPGPFIRESLAIAWREYESNPLLDIPPMRGADVPVVALENEPLLGFRAASIFWRHDVDRLFSALWPFLLWAPIAGLALLPLLRGRGTFLSLLVVPVVYLLACASGECFDQRYVAGVLPFALILAPAPLAALVEGWRRFAASP
jgi:hypothetical protein